MPPSRLLPASAILLALLGAGCSEAPPTASPATEPIEAPITIQVADLPQEDVLLLPPLDARAHADARTAYLELAYRLDADAFVAGVPELGRMLSTGTRAELLRAVRMCGASHDPRAIPLLVRELGFSDREVQVCAGAALSEVVTAHELRRRDPARLEEVYLLPRGEGGLDLRGLHWVVEEMLRAGPPLQGYAAAMAGYLGLDGLAPLLEALRGSRHGAVVHWADAALAQLERDRQR